MLALSCRPSMKRRGMPDSPAAAPISAPSAAPRWQFSPPTLVLVSTAFSKESACKYRTRGEQLIMLQAAYCDTPAQHSYKPIFKLAHAAVLHSHTTMHIVTHGSTRWYTQLCSVTNYYTHGYTRSHTITRAVTHAVTQGCRVYHSCSTLSPQAHNVRMAHAPCQPKVRHAHTWLYN